MANPCLPEKAEHLKNRMDIEKLWNNSKQITKLWGKYDGNNKLADIALNELTLKATEKSGAKRYDEDLFLNKSEVADLKYEVRQLESNLNKKNVTMFELLTNLPKNIADRTPFTRRFNRKMDLIMNYEKTKRDNAMINLDAVKTELKHAFMAHHQKIKGLKPGTIKEIKRLEKQFELASDENKGKYLTQLNDFIASSEGAVVRDYIDLMNMPYRELLKPSVLRDYPTHIINSAKLSRKMLGEKIKMPDGSTEYSGLSRVVMDGLDNLGGAAVIRFTGQTNKNHYSVKMSKNSSLRGLLKNIELAKERIKDGVEKGGYMPHIALEQVSRMRAQFEQMHSSSDAISTAAINKMDHILSMDLSMPDGARARNTMLFRTFSRDPLHVLQQYANDVIVFNRDASIKRNYLEAMKNLGTSDIDYIAGMHKYLRMQYEKSTRGINNPGSWANKALRLLGSYMTGKAMGFGLTGAARNLLSGSYWYGYKLSNEFKSVNDWLKDTNNKELIESVSKEQGFEFKAGIGMQVTESLGLGNLAASEGLMPEGGLKRSDIKFKISDKGEVETFIKGKDGKLQNLYTMADKTLQTAVNTSLVFHRLSENFLRRKMFEHGFAMTYKGLTNQDNFIRKPDAQGNVTEASMNRQRQLARKIATEAGLASISAWAFEYNLHNKAPIISGVATGKGTMFEGPIKAKAAGTLAMGSQVFMFLHYPMEFANSQYQALKGSAKKAYQDKRFVTQESKNVLAFAGVTAFSRILSLMFNGDFTGLLNNDTYDKIENFKDRLTLSEEELKKKRDRGMISDVTGPIVGDVMGAVNAMDIYESSDSRLERFFTGYQEWDDLTDEQKTESLMYKLGIGKSYKFFRDVLVGGASPSVLFMHVTGMYPKAWIKDTRKKFFDWAGWEQPKKKSKRKRKTLRAY